MSDCRFKLIQIHILYYIHLWILYKIICLILALVFIQTIKAITIAPLINYMTPNYDEKKIKQHGVNRS